MTKRKIATVARTSQAKSFADIIERFHARVDKKGPDECWNWQGGMQSKCLGYGRVGKVNGEFFYSHRLAYELANGAIPIGYYICHRCDNPLCCNPAHLFAGTGTHNSRDMVNKGRIGGRKKLLTQAQELEIRNSEESRSALAEKFSVSVATIRKTQLDAKHKEVVFISSDHNGVALKSKVREALQLLGKAVIDVGPFDNSTVDYTTYARQIANMIVLHPNSKAILICGTGTGMAITANKIPGVRAAVAHSVEVAQKSREHNNASVLCIGAWINTDDTNIKIAQMWVSSPFGEGRHVRRVEQIEQVRRHKLIFANGVFDILHKGHLSMLRWASSLGERLIVGINSDRAVRVLKGEDRPISQENDRKAVLDALRFVDEVIIFDDIKPTALINEIKPAIIVRGGEYKAEEIRARDSIPSHIDIKVFPLIAGYSTSKVIEEIKAGVG